MRAIESQWWILELPEEWQAQQEDDAIVIGDLDGVGEIVISTLQKQVGDVSDSELRDYTRDLTQSAGAGKPIEVADTRGYYFSFQDDDEALREWYLRSGDLLLLVTYCCDIENAGMDDGAVDEILSTLYIKTEEERDNQPAENGSIH